MEEQIELLVRDAGLRRGMAARAAREAQAKYSLEANTLKIVETFRTAVN